MKLTSRAILGFGAAALALLCSPPPRLRDHRLIPDVAAGDREASASGPPIP